MTCEYCEFFFLGTYILGQGFLTVGRDPLGGRAAVERGCEKMVITSIREPL